MNFVGAEAFGEPDVRPSFAIEKHS